MPPHSSETRALSTLSIGQRLEVGVGEDAVQWYPSRLEDFENGGQRFTVAWPTDRGRLIFVKPGLTLQIAASKDALYSARVQVERTSKDGVPVLTLRVIGPWQRAQRRNAVRIGVALRPRKAERLAGDNTEPLRLGITNISAGGISLRSQEELRVGDQIDLSFHLMGIDEELEVRAIVRRTERHDRSSLVIWEAGCEFDGLSPRLAQRIVQFIFDQQRAVARARKS